MSKMITPFVVGYYSDADDLKKACAASTEHKHRGHDAYTPYPVHGLEHELGYKRSLLGRPVLAILLFGACMGFFMQYFMLKVDWPINIAGKPYNSWPAFVVITFESGVLSAAVSNMALVLLAYCKILPHPNTKVINLDLTDDTFCLAIPVPGNGDEADIKKFLSEQGADNIQTYDSEDVEPICLSNKGGESA